MPVRVVSDKPVRFRRITCSRCFYELEYTNADLRFDSDGDAHITCPRPECRGSYGYPNHMHVRSAER